MTGKLGPEPPWADVCQWLRSWSESWILQALASPEASNQDSITYPERTATQQSWKTGRKRHWEARRKMPEIGAGVRGQVGCSEPGCSAIYVRPGWELTWPSRRGRTKGQHPARPPTLLRTPTLARSSLPRAQPPTSLRPAPRHPPNTSIPSTASPDHVLPDVLKATIIQFGVIFFFCLKKHHCRDTSGRNWKSGA